MDFPLMTSLTIESWEKKQKDARATGAKFILFKKRQNLLFYDFKQQSQR